jgi:hypothetical protein
MTNYEVFELYKEHENNTTPQIAALIIIAQILGEIVSELKDLNSKQK